MLSTLCGMRDAFFNIFTSGDLEWHETLPFQVGLLCVAIEILVRTVRRQSPIFDVPSLGYMLSEGITVCIIPIYGLALCFNTELAKQVAAKNSKTLAVGMFVAFLTLAIHIVRRWLTVGRARS